MGSLGTGEFRAVGTASHSMGIWSIEVVVIWVGLSCCGSQAAKKMIEAGTLSSYEV